MFDNGLSSCQACSKSLCLVLLGGRIDIALQALGLKGEVNTNVVLAQATLQ